MSALLGVQPVSSTNVSDLLACHPNTFSYRCCWSRWIIGNDATGVLIDTHLQIPCIC
jgi:hypothetical protein